MSLYKRIQSILEHPAMNVPRRYSFAFRCLVAREKALWPLYLPYVKWGQLKFENYGADRNERIITDGTELVVDGFQGSANSFAAARFKECQSRPVLFAHHMHSPTQIIQAVQRDIPTVVTIREPVGATVSLLRRWPHISTGPAIDAYRKFYGKLVPHLSRIVVSPFELTTGDLGRVFDKVNTLYATDFDTVVKEEDEKSESDPDRLAAYRQAKQLKRAEVLSAQHEKRLEEARDVYAKFHERATELFELERSV